MKYISEDWISNRRMQADFIVDDYVILMVSTAPDISKTPYFSLILSH